MSGIGRSTNRQEMSPHRLEAILRDEFSRETEAERDKVPDWRSITAMARLDRRGQASSSGSSAHRRRDDDRAREAVSQQ